MKVFILTKHDGMDPIFGAALCVFETIRIGFPTAELMVYDNHSHVASQIRIANCAKKVGSEFYGYETERGHWDYIESVIDVNEGPICFVDPDVIFYEEVEKHLLPIKELIAGRYCPAFYNPVVGCNEVERLHTSLLYISDPQILRSKMLNKENPVNYPASPYQGFLVWLNGKQYFYDTFANVYHRLSKSEISIFTHDMLDRYTHLVSGSMLNRVSEAIGQRLTYLHRVAMTDPKAVKGLWKEQDEFYKLHPVR